MIIKMQSFVDVTLTQNTYYKHYSFSHVQMIVYINNKLIIKSINVK